MRREESIDDRFSVAVRYASLVVFPLERGITRIRPDEIVQQAVIGNIWENG